jgi:hypothetical protein
MAPPWFDPGAFVRPWLIGAAVVTVLRFLNADGPDLDVSRQILAAHNLVSGRGLTVFDRSGPDLAHSASLVTLTHFPAGYSLAVAALFAVGIDVSIAVRLLGALATMFGWWGWARLAASFMGSGTSRSMGGTVAAIVVAFGMPLLFTPNWESTDIFLWAAVPWVVLWLATAGADDATARRFDIATGALCGLAILMRYASLFLVAYAGIVMLWQSRRRPALVVRRWSRLVVGLLPAFAVQFPVNYLLSESVSTPGGLTFGQTTPVLERLVRGISLFHASNDVWAFWMPGKVLAILFPREAGPMSLTGPSLPWQLGLTVAFGVWLALAAVTYHRLGSRARDPRTLSLGLFVAIPVVLFAAMTEGNWGYVGDRRYYMPLIPLAVLVAYSLVFGGDRDRPRGWGALARALGGIYLAGCVAMILVYLAFLPLPGRVGDVQRLKLLGGRLVEWPSLSMLHERSPARRFALSRLKQADDPILLTSRPAAFDWDPSLDHSLVIPISCYSHNAQFISGPATVIIHTFDKGGPTDLWEYAGTELEGWLEPDHCLDGLPDLHLVQSFPDEGFKVLESRIPAGQRVELRR